jgi:hypothetical protein
MLLCGGESYGGGGKGVLGLEEAVVARVNGVEITYGEVDREVARSRFRYLEWAYRARLEALKRIAVRRIVEEKAMRSGVDAGEFLRGAVDTRGKQLGDDVARRWWEEHEEMLTAQGQSFEESLERIEENVYGEQETAVWNLLYDAVVPVSEVEVLFGPPRMGLLVGDDAPARGRRDAAVEIVEYCDFR